MAGKGTLTVQVVGDASKFEKTMGKLQGGIGKFGKAAALGMAGVAVGVGAIGVEALKSLARVETIGAQTDAVIKSTGGAAGVTRKQIDDLAGSIEAMSGVEAEAITEGQNLLLTFKNIKNSAGEGNDIFDQSTKALVDMSVAMGTEPKAAAIQLGKALNDPIKGIAALSRVGITFTKDQEDMIKSIVAARETMVAQKMILGELNSQFGGSAEAMGNTMTGRIERLKHQFGNLTEEIAARLLPVIERLIEWATEFLPPAFAAIVSAVESVKAKWDEVFPTMQAVFETFAAVVSTVIETVRGLFSKSESDVGGSASRIGQILSQLKEMFASAFEAIKVVVETVVKIVLEMWDRFGATLLDRLKAFVGPIQDVVKGMLSVLTGIFDLIKAVLTGKWGEAWDAIKQILGGAWDAIGGLIRTAFATVALAFEAFKATVSAVWSVLWNSVKTVVSDVLGGIVSAVTGMPGKIASAAAGMFDGIKDAFRGAVNWIIDKWNGLELKLGGQRVSLPFGMGFDIPSVTLRTPTIPRFRGGVENFKGGLAYVHGGEVLANLAPGTDVIPKHKVSAMGGGGDIHIHIGTVFGDERAVKKLTEQIRRELLHTQRRNPGLGFV